MVVQNQIHHNHHRGHHGQASSDPEASQAHTRHAARPPLPERESHEVLT